MCGIAGILGYNNDPIENIEAMNEAMIERGPDDGSFWLDENRHVVLGHRRLSIIDLSEFGRQPMVSHSGDTVIVFNGEIYNAAELRANLENKYGQISWNGHSDTEVILEGFDRDENVYEAARGMWGIATYNRKTGEVLLSRDRMGEKPLYYGKVNGQFVFASSINSIRALKGFNNPVNAAVLSTYLRDGYIPAPYSIYEDIYKLTPGCVLTIKPPYSEWKIDSYYDIRQTAEYGQTHLFTGTEEEAANELERRLKDTLRGQMISDVPLGAFLSGGIDSTLVVSLMQSISDRPVKSFTIGFEEKQYDEAIYARETAKLLGTEHTELYVGYKDVMNALNEIPRTFGEPFADSSELPTMLVSQMTRKNVTVALSGDAGDEFFCGYNTYKDAKTSIDVMRSKLGFVKDPIRGGIGNLILNTPLKNNQLFNTVGRCFTIKTVEDFFRMVRDDDPRINRLTGSSEELPNAMNTYKEGFLVNDISNLMLMDMIKYLPDDILTKVDRSGMHYSLETRIPLLDKTVMEFAWSLPLEYKMRDGITKRPLRNILYKYVPKEMMERPKKGFSVPVSKWLREGEMHDWAEAILNDARPFAKEFIDVSLVDKIWTDYQHGGDWNALIWYILMFEQWLVTK